MAVPILKDDTPQGVVFGILDIQMVLDSLKNMKENPIYTQIVDSNGIPITHLKTDTWMLGAKNIWDYYKQCKFINGNAERIKKICYPTSPGITQWNARAKTELPIMPLLVLEDTIFFLILDFLR